MTRYKLTVTMEIGQQLFSYALTTDDALELGDAYEAFKEFGGDPSSLARGVEMLADKMKEIRAKREEEIRKAVTVARGIFSETGEKAP